MADVNEIYPHVLQFEGGYANVKGDRGGETYIGIARNSNPDWAGWAIIDANKPLKHNAIIQQPELMKLHRDFLIKRFWEPMHGNEIQSQRIANFIFDMFWGSGYKGLQQANAVVNSLSGKQIPKYNMLTVAEINKLNEADLLPALYKARKEFLQKLAQKPEQAQFLKGWLRRLDAVTGKALDFVKSNPVKTGGGTLLFLLMLLIAFSYGKNKNKS